MEDRLTKQRVSNRNARRRLTPAQREMTANENPPPMPLQPKTPEDDIPQRTVPGKRLDPSL